MTCKNLPSNEVILEVINRAKDDAISNAKSFGIIVPETYDMCCDLNFENITKTLKKDLTSIETEDIEENQRIHTFEDSTAPTSISEFCLKHLN